MKGIGDGEPITSERFSVGGHEWVLLFYPDGKRSSSTEGDMHGGQILLPPVAAPPFPGVDNGPERQGAALGGLPMEQRAAAGAGAAGAGAAAGVVGEGEEMAHPPGAGANPANAHPGAAAPAPAQHHQHQAVAPPARQVRRDTTNEYAALFVALIGEGPNPQGMVNTSEGKVVRAFHCFTLVDQTGQGRDLTKGRTRDAGAVKISCARQDPNARNCHGYRKFVKRSILEDPSRGFLVNDTIVIKYTIELVVSSGGALSRTGATAQRTELIRVPPPNLGSDLVGLLTSGNESDCTFVVENEEMKVHKIILEARSPVFRALLSSDMREGHEGRVVVQDIKASVFRVMLHFVYSDSLPEEHEGLNLEVPMAQHLLVAADQYQLVRLRRFCERRLCETVDVETVATTLTLAEQNHAEDLKKVCLEYVSRNLAAVMNTDGFRHMTRSCPQLQAEILSTIATGPAGGAAAAGDNWARRSGVRFRDNGPAGTGEDEGRRVRPRLRE
eukprot:gene5005-34789_t